MNMLQVSGIFIDPHVFKRGTDIFPFSKNVIMYETYMYMDWNSWHVKRWNTSGLSNINLVILTSLFIFDFPDDNSH